MGVRERVHSIDALRGAIIILMAIDHVRDFFHIAAGQFQPEDLTRTSVILFFTRWITHFCAPTFAFTAGVGAYFWQSRGRSAGELSRFLWSRGLWLVLLEITAMRFALNFNYPEGPVYMIVFWSLGMSMVILGFLVYLPLQVLTPLSIAVIALHNLLNGVKFTGWWAILHGRPVLPVAGIPVVFVYPLIPWFAVMSLGYCFGPVLSLDAARRRQWMFRLGLGMTIAFVVLRAINGYGDPNPWTPQKDGVFTFLSFLNTLKYPPSPDYLLMTLGPALLFASWLDRLKLSAANPMMVFGRVPLLFFLAHFYLIHLLAAIVAFIHYGNPWLFHHPPPTLGGEAPLPKGTYGYPLWAVYLAWLTVLVVLYPLCRWYAGLKERRRDWWLSYL